MTVSADHRDRQADTGDGPHPAAGSAGPGRGRGRIRGGEDRCAADPWLCCWPLTPRAGSR